MFYELRGLIELFRVGRCAYAPAQVGEKNRFGISVFLDRGWLLQLG